MTRHRFTGLALIAILSLAALAGCMEHEQSADEYPGPGDETGDIVDRDDLGPGQDGSPGNDTDTDMNETTDAS